MTYDDDFLHLEFDGGAKRITCKAAGVDWPPPERINVLGFDLVRESYSQITDEQRAGLTMVMRGARYVPAGSEAVTP